MLPFTRAPYLNKYNNKITKMSLQDYRKIKETRDHSKVRIEQLNTDRYE